MTHWKHALVSLTVLGLMAVGCSDDPGDSDQIASLEEQLADLAAERDDLAAQLELAESRYEKTAEVQQAIADIIADPEAYGTETEALDSLAALATDDAVMDDTALGAIGIRDAWKQTLFGLDASITTWHTWISEDGSNSGSLWIWSGSAANGEPFELVGINLDSHNSEGLLSYELVTWPYPPEYVERALAEGNVG